MCVCVFIVFSLYVCIELNGTKHINDVALNKKTKFVCLFVCLRDDHYRPELPE